MTRRSDARSVPHLARRRVRRLRLELRNLPRQVFQDPLAQRGIGAECHLRDGLGKRRDNFVDIDGVFFTAQRAILGIKVVDHVADEAVQTGPLVIRFRSIRHGQSSHTQIRSVSAAVRAAPRTAPAGVEVLAVPRGPLRLSMIKVLRWQTAKMETITECYISVGQVPVYLVRMLQRTLPAGFIAAVPSNAH